MKNINDILSVEIEATKKHVRPVNIQLVKQQKTNIYKGFLPFKIEGEYVLNSQDIADKVVYVEWKNDHIEIELECDDDRISAFLSKDEASLLRALQANIKQNHLTYEPAFIIGPPGTGKTKVITRGIEEAVKAKMKILVVSPTNQAVENVLERIDTKSMQIQNGDLVSTIKTDKASLLEFSIEKVKTRKLQPIEDEIEILEEAKKEMLKIKRNLQPTVHAIEADQDANATLLSNYKQDLAIKEAKVKELICIIQNIQHRINTLSRNTLLQAIANIFTDKKVDELEVESIEIEKKVNLLNAQISDLKNKILVITQSSDQTKDRLKKSRTELNNITDTIQKVNKKLKDLKVEVTEILENNIFSNAKIVCSTLIHACLNQKIQAAEFDLILIDEVSMATIPQIVVVSQALNKNKIRKMNYELDSGLTDAQSNAVKLILNSKLVCIGDPCQLQPIAITDDMRQSIFSFYAVEKIFEGIEVKNTVLLNINFRNHPHIANLSSQLFYGGLLKSGKPENDLNSVFIRRSKSKMVSSESSFVNYGNMKIVIEQINKAIARGRRDIGVITPYRKQAELIQENIKSLLHEYPDADIKVGTIHSFQGQEKEIIIFDLTFSPKDSKFVPTMYQGDISSNTAKLLNVAMTRAKDFFIVIGDVEGILNLSVNNLVLKQWLEKIND